MREKFRQLKYWWNCTTSGLENFVDDVRDLRVKNLFGEDTYKPKAQKKILAPIYEKDQKTNSNCSFQTASRVLSVYFGEDISVRWLVAKAWQQGLCQKGGGAQLRNWAKVAQKYGVLFEKDLPTNEDLTWEEYVNVPFEILDPQALKNRIGSYWRVDTVAEYLRCIDEGYAVALGRKWYTTYNQGGGFKSPWILTKQSKKNGISLSAHATSGVGYDMTKNTSVEANSYSFLWGDKGSFYCELDQLQEDLNEFHGYAITPVPYMPKEIKVSLMMKVVELLSQLVELMKEATNASEKLYKSAYTAIGENLAPGNEQLGCAISMSAVYNRAFPEKKPVRFVNTSQWVDYAEANPKEFKRLSEVEPGCLIVHPTNKIPANSPLMSRPPEYRHGHVWVCGKNKAPDGSYYTMSNNSNTGKWDAYWTKEMIDTYFTEYAKIPAYYYRVLV